VRVTGPCLIINRDEHREIAVEIVLLDTAVVIVDDEEFSDPIPLDKPPIAGDTSA